MNVVTMKGNLGQAPEIKTGENSEFAVFSIAINDNYINREGKEVTRTEWVPCVCYTPGIVKFIKEHVSVGDTIHIMGKFTSRKFSLENVVNTKQDNAPYEMTRSTIEVKELHKVFRPAKVETQNEQA
jgi:single-stranded DNA-binding protein